MTVLSSVLLTQPSVLAQGSIVGNLSYQEVSQDLAISKIVNISVNPGRIAVIDFSATEQAIAYIGLGDASRVVYNTDFPLQSGSAQTIFLLPIERLDFPGTTTTRITNLVLKTVDPTGKSRLYNFQINHSNSITNLGVKITPTTRNLLADINRDTIKVSYGRTANLDDVARGLTIAINKEFTVADDPVVGKVRRFIALARNSELTVVESAQSADIDLAVISSLAEMALEEFSFELPGENSVTDLETETEVQDSDELSSISETVESSTVTDREKDLSGYLTKQTPQPSLAKEISFDEQIDYVLQANNLYFGWQRVVRQENIEQSTQAKVNRAINSVRNGSSLEEALIKVEISEPIGLLLQAINRAEGDFH
ncbi:MAG: hypothetical protein QNJ55_32635 [Xenococcus sp. MO_188.B8]|nr:hypothetical protein [Xenococcus sp. MO_188.B8]